MNMKTLEQKSSEALTHGLHTFAGYLNRLLPELNLGYPAIPVSQTLNLHKPNGSQDLVRSKRFFRSSLIAVACALVGVASALADPRLTVTAATGGEAIPATTANGAWTTLTGPILTEGDPRLDRWQRHDCADRAERI